MPGRSPTLSDPVAQTREHRLDRLASGIGPGVHDRQRSARAPATPPETGESTYPMPAAERNPSIVLAAGDPDRRGVDDVRGPSVGGGGDRPRHLLGGARIGKAEHDNLRASGDLVDARCEVRTGWATTGPRQVVGDHLVSRPDQVGPQDAPHVAQSHEPDGRDRHRSVPSARTAWSARFAESPAGAPQ